MNLGVIAAAGASIGIPGVNVATSAAAVLPAIISVIDPGKARDAARINRRDFFLNAAKAGSVIACQYLISGEANVYTDKEKGQYRDGVTEMTTKAPEVLARAQALGGRWDADVGAGNLLPAGQLIATELGTIVNVPAGVANVNQQGAIAAWASQFGYSIQKAAAQSVASGAAAVGAAAASAIAPAGSAQKQSVLIPTTQSTILIAVLAGLALVYFAMRKR